MNYPVQCRSERPKFRGHGLPNDVLVDLEIAVHQPVAHAHDVLPGDLGVRLPSGGGYAVRGL